MTFSEFTETVYAIASTHGGSCTSWFRSEKRNRDVGGKPESLHRRGLAMDLVFDEASGAAEATKLMRAAGLHTLDERTHIHVQALPPGPDRPITGRVI